MRDGPADGTSELDVYLVSPVPSLAQGLRARGRTVFECTPEAFDRARTIQLHNSSRVTVVPIRSTWMMPGKSFTTQVRRARRLVKGGDHRLVALYLKPSPGFSVLAATRVNAYDDKGLQAAAHFISEMVGPRIEKKAAGEKALVFLSYRRGGLDAMATGRLKDHIVQSLRKEQVFLDVDSIPAGVSFSDHIRNALTTVRVLLAIVGPDWQPVRLQEEDDWIRLELATAYKAGISIIPVLLGSTAMPCQDEIPADLEFFPTIQAVRLRSDPDFVQDAQKIVGMLQSSTGWQ